MHQKNFKLKRFLINLACAVSLAGCTPKEQASINPNLDRARQTLDSLYQTYSVPNTYLLREYHPFDDRFAATYASTEDQTDVPNPFSYLWSYASTFSAVNALLEATQDPKYKELLNNRILPGLEEYFNSEREPHGYASYTGNADRFYDDNIWLGIDFIDAYTTTREAKHLDKAKMVWKFITSGMDDQLDGGIYWCEQNKGTKNTCSNAPAAVLALKLFKVTKDSIYFAQGKALYEWTKAHLQDSTDYLYFDNIRMDGKIGKAKYAYNSGQMMQSAAMLYQLTNDPVYLADAQNIAKGCYNYFFSDFSPATGESFKLLRKGNIWFYAVMLRGFIELYHQDKNKTYLDVFNKNMDYAWNNARDEEGLFTEIKETNKEDKKWLLTQSGMIEMYSRLAVIK